MRRSKVINVDGEEYELDSLSKKGKDNVLALQFTTNRIHELESLRAVLQRAKNSYMESIRKEIISDKAGYLFDNE